MRGVIGSESTDRATSGASERLAGQPTERGSITIMTGIRERFETARSAMSSSCERTASSGSRFGALFPAIAPLLLATYQAVPSLTLRFLWGDVR